MPSEPENFHIDTDKPHEKIVEALSSAFSLMGDLKVDRQGSLVIQLRSTVSSSLGRTSIKFIVRPSGKGYDLLWNLNTDVFEWKRIPFLAWLPASYSGAEQKLRAEISYALNDARKQLQH
jgi:hypothetical protein